MKNTQSTSYIYHFTDGTEFIVHLDSLGNQADQEEWFTALTEFDRLEYNNQHAETRRHNSLEAQDPMSRGGFYESNSMEKVQLSLELEDSLRSMPDDLRRIVFLLKDGYSASDIARMDNVHRSSISRKIYKIQKLLKDAGFQ